jgi:type I restriction enzyme M protein
MLDCIIQLPNNLFYNTGITTYIWLLHNNKEAKRKGKVLLIDASQRFAKLRKNLGNKNCELAPEHIKEILNAYLSFKSIDRQGDDGLAAKVFDNSDFGYYKVTIDRPARLKAQFTAEKIADLRFDRSIKEAMAWAYETYGERAYTDLASIEKEILDWCEKNDLDLNAKKRKALTSAATWKKHKDILEVAQQLLESIGSEVFNDFNLFSDKVNAIFKEKKIKLSASEKNQIMAAVSWYDETAEKVIKKKQKLSGDKLDQLLHHLDCTVDQLPDYGYYPSENPNEYIIYDNQTDLRDNESVPLAESIHDYFMREVKPHVEEAWIDLEKTKIGYEISFNKYFYQHKPLRPIEEVSAEILELEKENEGLIMDILNLS